MRMKESKNLYFQNKLYTKLKEAEQEAQLQNKRYTSKDVLKALKDVIKDAMKGK